MENMPYGPQILRPARAAIGLTIAALAALVQIHPNTLMSWETSVYPKIPSRKPELWRRYCDALEVPPADLLAAAELLPTEDAEILRELRARADVAGCAPLELLSALPTSAGAEG